jgi:hypothetical protein
MRGLLAGLLAAAALTRGATAAVIPAPITANLVNFDNIPGATEIPYPGPLTTELAFEGVVFSGFGQNGGAVLGTGEGIGLPEISPPNFLVFVSAFPMQNGGLPQSPEFIDFYPPIRRCSSTPVRPASTAREQWC